MSWAKSDDLEPLHPKFLTLRLPAYGFFQAAKCYASRNLTDGFIPIEALGPGIYPHSTHAECLKLAELLSSAVDPARPGSRPLFEKVEGGWQIHDYLEYNPSAAEVRVRRERARQRVQKCRSHKRNGVTARTVTLSPSPFPSPSPTREEKTTTLSSSTLDGCSKAQNPFREQAIEILTFLNSKAARSYRSCDANLGLIVARLKSGASIEDCRGVIARKVREWGRDPKMAKYLRPATLFGVTKFEQYLGEREPSHAIG